MTELDPRLERHRPALRYDSQEPYRAMSAASITDNEGNVLLAGDGAELARAGGGGGALNLAHLAAYPGGRTPDARDRLDEAPDPLSAARRLQADSRYADRCYGRVVAGGDRTWLQYWLWFYDNPRNLLGFGSHEGDWELVQVGLGAGDRPQVVTCSQHESGEAKDWERVERLGAHPVVYVAPLSHANYYEAGAHPYMLGVDNPDGAVEAVLARVEPFGAWAEWPGRWGGSAGVLARWSGGRLGGRSPAGPGRQGVKWEDPAGWHRRAQLATPFRSFGRLMRQVGRLTHPRLQRLAAERAPGGIAVEWALDRALLRPAGRLLVTVHPLGSEELMLASHPLRIHGRAGSETVPLPAGAPPDIVVRASAYNALRQRSDPLEARVA